MKTMRVIAPLGLAFGLALSPAAFANKEPAKKDAKPTATKTAAAAPASTERGRDWTKIDTNGDGLISPDEMETWLKANPGPAK